MPPVRTSRVPAPLAVEGWYMVQLQRLVRAVLLAIEAELQPILAELAAEERQDAEGKPVPIRVLHGLDRLKVKVRQTAAGFPAAEVVAQAAAKVEVFNSTGIGQVAKELGLSVQPLKGSAKLQAARDRFMAENTALIKDIPEDMRARIEAKVRAGVESGKRWETIAKDLEGEQGINERRARLIARDQVNKYNGALTEARMTKLGITHYRWQGAMDQRERPTHVALNGLVFAWDKPPPEGHPGFPIQCRCVAIPVTAEKEKAKAQNMTEEQLKARTAAVTEKYNGKAKKVSKAAPAAKKAEPAKAAKAAKATAAKAKATAAKTAQAEPAKKAAEAQATPAAAAQAAPAAAAQAAPAHAQSAPAGPKPIGPDLASAADPAKPKYAMPTGKPVTEWHPLLEVPESDVMTASVQTHLKDIALMPTVSLDAIGAAGIRVGIANGPVSKTPAFAEKLLKLTEFHGKTTIAPYIEFLDMTRGGTFNQGMMAVAIGNLRTADDSSVAIHELFHALDIVVFSNASSSAEWAIVYRRWTGGSPSKALKHFPGGHDELMGEHGKQELFAELGARYIKEPEWLKANDREAFDFISGKLDTLNRR